MRRKVWNGIKKSWIGEKYGYIKVANTIIWTIWTSRNVYVRKKNIRSQKEMREKCELKIWAWRKYGHIKKEKVRGT